MKRVSVAQFRKNLAAYLDDAAAGEEILVESAGRRVVVRPAPAERTARRKLPDYSDLLAALPPAVLTGEWKWEWDHGTPTFVDLRPAAKRRRRA